MSSDEEEEGAPPKIYIGGPEEGKHHELHDGEISPLAGKYAKLQQHWNKMSNASPGPKNRDGDFDDEDLTEKEKESLLRTDDSLLEQELQ